MSLGVAQIQIKHDVLMSLTCKLRGRAEAKSSQKETSSLLVEHDIVSNDDKIIADFVFTFSRIIFDGKWGMRTVFWF
jgi:hypothetical protein